MRRTQCFQLVVHDNSFSNTLAVVLVWLFQNKRLEFQPASPQQAIAALRDVQPHAAPGAAYEYANANYMLLGMLVEAVSHQS